MTLSYKTLGFTRPPLGSSGMPAPRRRQSQQVRGATASTNTVSNNLIHAWRRCSKSKPVLAGDLHRPHQRGAAKRRAGV